MPITAATLLKKNMTKKKVVKEEEKENLERNDEKGKAFMYRVSQEECAGLREGVPYVKVYRYNPKHLCPKLNGYGDNGQRSLKLRQLLHTY